MAEELAPVARIQLVFEQGVLRDALVVLPPPLRVYELGHMDEELPEVEGSRVVARLPLGRVEFESEPSRTGDWRLSVPAGFVDVEDLGMPRALVTFPEAMSDEEVEALREKLRVEFERFRGG